MGTLYKHRGCRSLVAAQARPGSASSNWLLRTRDGRMVRPRYGSTDLAHCPCGASFWPAHWFVEPVSTKELRT